jgi:hypothetical protein
MARRSARSAKARQAATPRSSRTCVEDIKDPRENQDPTPPSRAPQPKDTENPPNENLNKDPDEAYGDTQIPHRNHPVRGLATGPVPMRKPLCSHHCLGGPTPQVNG